MKRRNWSQKKTTKEDEIKQLKEKNESLVQSVETSKKKRKIRGYNMKHLNQK